MVAVVQGRHSSCCLPHLPLLRTFFINTTPKSTTTMMFLRLFPLTRQSIDLARPAAFRCMFRISSRVHQPHFQSSSVPAHPAASACSLPPCPGTYSGLAASSAAHIGRRVTGEMTRCLGPGLQPPNPALWLVVDVAGERAYKDVWMPGGQAEP